MHFKSIIKYVIGFLIVAGAGYFFVREFYANYDSIAKFDFKINSFYLLTSQIILILTTLAGTFFWQQLLKMITAHKINFRESLAIVNTSQLTKYLPGKVWSYALQMVLLSRQGISKTVVLYANLFLAMTSLFASAFLGLLYFVCFSPDQTRFWLTIFVAFLILYIGFIFLNQSCLKILIRIIEKIFKKTINYTHIDIKWIIVFQFLYLLANAIFGITGYLLAIGLGFSVSIQNIFAVSASLIIADMIGFIILIAPGGLGVREGIMFALLAALGDRSLALLLPVGTRIMGMVSDLLLGGVGFIFLRKYYAGKNNYGNDKN
ncbi:MAG: lysylphosphatidylglycerol synthase transmembrane domain-containing protein [Smithella sp.]